MHEVIALPLRIALLVGVAVAAHLAVAFVQRAVRRATAARVAESAGEQFAGTLMVAPTFEGRHTTAAGDAYVRVRFRVWPGQGALVDGPIRAQVLAALREIDPQVGDWRVAVHYRAELAAPIPARRLPRPSVLEHYGEI